MSFLIYDLVFLVAFLIFISVFLYTRKHNLKKEGLLFLYRTSWGIKIINHLILDELLTPGDLTKYQENQILKLKRWLGILGI